MLITFDPAKRDATLSARELDMAEAGGIFADPRLVIKDERKTMAKSASSRSD